MFDERLPRLPDDWHVWAFSDSHGVTSGLVTALCDAGLTDDTGHWMAPPRTALVGCGDYIDRGGDIPGTVSLLRRLQREAAAVGGAVLLARGNHEAMPLMVRDGRPDWLTTWLDYGGRQTVASFGCDDPDDADVERVMAILDRCQPGFLDWLASLHEGVRWRDVLFVHGGLAPGFGPEDLGRTTEEHLWVRSAFFDTPWLTDDFAAYRAAGIERVVFGHTPQWDGPTLHHDGHSLGIDTNAVGNPRMPERAVQELTLAGLSGWGDFDETHFIRVPTRDAPDTMRGRDPE